MLRTAAPVSATLQIPTEGGALVLAGTAAEGAYDSATLAGGEERQTHYLLDPNAIIAVAFKAAGLPVPEISSVPPDTTPHVEPGPIIAAALKAAGLS